MNYFDDESNIIECLQNGTLYKCAFPSNSVRAKRVLDNVCNPKKWKKWHNSSGKSDPPPDFYCEEYRLMMDVMRVDDHTRLNDKGKVCNPTNQRESMLQKELRQKGILDAFPNVKRPIINAITDLPTLEDHNYQFYYTAFERTVKKHIESIPLYRENHPECRVVFLIFDESSGYVQTEDPELVKSGAKCGRVSKGSLYLHFTDKRFLSVFQNTDIDYVIWFSPFKHFNSTIPYELPNLAVYDVKRYTYGDAVEYPENMIMSVEE